MFFSVIYADFLWNNNDHMDLCWIAYGTFIKLLNPFYRHLTSTSTWDGKGSCEVLIFIHCPWQWQAWSRSSQVDCRVVDAQRARKCFFFIFQLIYRFERQTDYNCEKKVILSIVIESGDKRYDNDGGKIRKTHFVSHDIGMIYTHCHSRERFECQTSSEIGSHFCTVCVFESSSELSSVAKAYTKRARKSVLLYVKKIGNWILHTFSIFHRVSHFSV